jgi:hypothetical protein
MAEIEYLGFEQIDRQRAKAERRSKEIVLLEWESGGFSESPFPERLVDFVAFLDSLKGSVPKKFRRRIKIEISSVSGYEGAHYPSVRVSFVRLETQKEASERVAAYELQRQHQRDFKLRKRMR